MGLGHGTRLRLVLLVLKFLSILNNHKRLFNLGFEVVNYMGYKYGSMPT